MRPVHQQFSKGDPAWRPCKLQHFYALHLWCRVAVEVAEKLAAWSPPVPAPQELASGIDPPPNSPPDPRLAAAALQAQAAAAAVDALLRLLPKAPVANLSTSGSSNVFRVLSACCQALLGTAVRLLQQLQQELGRSMPCWPAERQRAMARALLVHCTLLLQADARLLSYLQRAAKDLHLGKPALAALTSNYRAATLHNLWAQHTMAAELCSQHFGEFERVSCG